LIILQRQLTLQSDVDETTTWFNDFLIKLQETLMTFIKIEQTASTSLDEFLKSKEQVQDSVVLATERKNLRIFSDLLQIL
jgi:hypothetical protein